VIYFEDYLDKGFILGLSQEPTNTIRSSFDYGVRQRRGVKGYPTHATKMVLSFLELETFKEMWDDLNDGNDKFYLSQNIHGDETINKEVRFTQGYSLQKIGASKYEIKAVLELIKTGVDPTSCPLVPSDLLRPSDTLVPCG